MCNIEDEITNILEDPGSYLQDIEAESRRLTILRDKIIEYKKNISNNGDQEEEDLK